MTACIWHWHVCVWHSLFLLLRYLCHGFVPLAWPPYDYFNNVVGIIWRYTFPTRCMRMGDLAAHTHGTHTHTGNDKLFAQHQPSAAHMHTGRPLSQPVHCARWIIGSAISNICAPGRFVVVVPAYACLMPINSQHHWSIYFIKVHKNIQYVENWPMNVCNVVRASRHYWILQAKQTANVTLRISSL